MSSMATQTEKVSKRLPLVLIELLDVAIFSFASLSGLKSTDKVRGDPVLNGVCALFGSLLSCAKESVMEEFDGISPGRLGGWRPGNEPTKELLTFVSSRMKHTKSAGKLTEMGERQTPSLLVETKHKYLEASDRVTTRFSPRCWRCGQLCRFCRLRKQSPASIATFRVE